MKNTIILLSFFSVLFIFLCGCSYSEPREITRSEEESASEEAQSDTILQETPTDIYVSIFGEVTLPGVYIMSDGSRIYELINKAGGTTMDADISGINMVALLTDGTQLYVPSLYSESDSGKAAYPYESSLPSNGKVNINNADVSELMTITGIGSSRANAIVSYREKNGKFKSVSDIMNVSGIKEKTYESIKDYICVD